MTGVDDPYEVPSDPDLRIDTATINQLDAVALLADLLSQRGITKNGADR